MTALLCVVILVLMDQFSKFLVVVNLKGKPPLVLIDNFLSFYYIENRGAAFGILQGRKLLFTIVTIVVVVILLYMLYKYYKTSSFLFKTSLVLILGGTLGNFIDRIRLDYVVDFISTRIFGYDFAIFNLADTFIVIGSFLLVLMILLHDNEKGRVR